MCTGFSDAPPPPPPSRSGQRHSQNLNKNLYIFMIPLQFQITVTCKISDHNLIGLLPVTYKLLSQGGSHFYWLPEILHIDLEFM